MGADCSRDWWTISGRRRERFAGRRSGAPMQLGLILLLIEVALIVHAAKTGRFWPWGLIIFFIPGFGALAYVLIELLPEWFGSAQGQQARRRVVSTLIRADAIASSPISFRSPTPSRTAPRSPRSAWRWENSKRRWGTMNTSWRCRWAMTRSTRWAT